MTVLDKHIANTELALKLWLKRVTAEMVVRDLNVYRCGSQACFGGLLTTWPEFQDMGVWAYSGADPVPMLGESYGQRVAEELFGEYELFSSRGWYEPDRDGTGLSDYDLVTHRLRFHLAKLHAMREAAHG